MEAFLSLVRIIDRFQCSKCEVFGIFLLSHVFLKLFLKNSHEVESVLLTHLNTVIFCHVLHELLL